MQPYTAPYGHNGNATPGRLTFDAASRADAIKQARAFVAAGQRNGTWINMTISDNESYAARNEHGAAVGE